MKIYDLGTIKASIERTTAGYYLVHVKCGNNVFDTINRTEVEALREILSYCETDDESL